LYASVFRMAVRNRLRTLVAREMVMPNTSRKNLWHFP